MINLILKKQAPTVVCGIVMLWTLFATLDLAERAGLVHETSQQDEQALSGWTQALKSDLSFPTDRQFVTVLLPSLIAACMFSVQVQHQLNTPFCPRTILPALGLHQLFSTYRI